MEGQQYRKHRLFELRVTYYDKVSFVIDEKALKKIVGRIVKASRPSRVIVFGSQGRGDAGQYSDLDIMVIKPHIENRADEMVRLRGVVGSVGIGVDVLVYSETEVEECRDWCTSPVYWALREGRTLYASHSTHC